MEYITSLTRRDIIDQIKAAHFLYLATSSYGDTTEGMLWHGKMSEIDFLDRTFSLHKLPSKDSRFSDAWDDVYQHRVAFQNDWPEGWIFEDDRLQLGDGEDEPLLTFLTQMFHPLVRYEAGNWEEYLNIYNELLKPDGYELYTDKKLSGRDIYTWRRTDALHQLEILAAPAFDTDYIKRLAGSMVEATTTNPLDAIGKAKELIESCCVTILNREGIAVDKEWTLGHLAKQACKQLDFKEDTFLSASTVKSMKALLAHLSGSAMNIAELRNSYGSGHGKDAEFIGLTPKYAKLITRTATAFAEFVWDTYTEQKDADNLPVPPS